MTYPARATTAVVTVLLMGTGLTAAGCPRTRPTMGHVPCAIERLAVPPGYLPPSAITAGDRTGRFLVGRAYPANAADGPLLLWDNGRPKVVRVSSADAELTAVNSGATAIGHAVDTDRTLFSFLYHDGAITRLRGRGSVALALNDRGAAAGYAGTLPVWWRDSFAEPEPLPLPGNDWRGEALAIGDDGVIVGRVWPPAPSTESRAYAWFPDGSHRELPGAEVAVAYRDGWAVGRTGNSTLASVRWDLRDPKETALPATPLSANVVNASGAIAGAGPPAMLAAGNVRVALSTSVPGYLAGSEADVASLSDDGRALAGTLIVTPDSGGQIVRVAVRWLCASS